MSDPSTPSDAAAAATTKHEPSKQAPKQNPAFRMLGLPNFRARLPSRNWLIFLSITGSIAAAITYDRQQKKAAQQKWCDLVAHISQQPLPANQMPRKLTIFLSAPPGDGIRPSRQYFKEYIKPILVAAAMDYDVVEGRKEGDVRYGTAEQIRRLRRKEGEKGQDPEQEEMDREMVIDMARQQLNIRPDASVKGDVVIGRHTWKEYLRGVHEGWLGPLDKPVPIPLSKEPTPTSLEITTPSADTDPLLSSPADDKPAQEVDEKTKKSNLPSTSPAYISTTAYSASENSPNLPALLEPSSPIPHRHILGFLNTPVRIYRFFTQRYLADSIGREIAAIVLGFNRPYHHHHIDYQSSTSGSHSSTADIQASPVSPLSPENTTLALEATKSEPPMPPPLSPHQEKQVWEQHSVLEAEEADWHKSVRKPRHHEDSEDPERVWLDEITMDERIAKRMRTFEMPTEEEERAKRIGLGLEEVGRD